MQGQLLSQYFARWVVSELVRKPYLVTLLLQVVAGHICNGACSRFQSSSLFQAKMSLYNSCNPVCDLSNLDADTYRPNSHHSAGIVEALLSHGVEKDGSMNKI